ncbi:MAG TPA: asparagine synthase-related protein [Caulobacteraceae bacterium]
MSAIFGLLRFDGAAADPRDLERMQAALAHRGPDGRRFVVDGAAGLGHLLRRVNREDVHEAQPLCDAHLTLVADARLDNREALAAELGLDVAALAGTPDSALILAACKAWGEAAPEHLLGDFAYALWDSRAGRLTLARDHMGQRGFAYHAGEGFFAFATQFRGLWALADAPRRLDEGELGRMMLLTPEARPEGTTLYAGLAGLPGGATLTVSAGGALAIRRYWTPRADPAHEGRDEAYYVAAYRRVITEAVECRLRRLVHPAALMLSGGFDSAAIAGLAGPVVTAQGRKLVTVSEVVSEAHSGGRWDIRRWIEACRRVMPHLDVRYLEAESVSPLQGAERRFLLGDAPSPGGGWMHRLFAEAAGAGCRLVMDGIGGDYTLNPRGYAALARWVAQGRLGRFFAELGPHMRLTGQSPWRVLKSELGLHLLRGPALWLRRLRRGGPRIGTAYAIAPGFLKTLQDAGEVPLQRRAETGSRLDMRGRIALAAAQAAGARVPPVEAVAGAYGLAFSRPFHDKRVVELGLAIPEDLYVKGGRSRYLACRALADIYPPSFMTRGRGNDGVTPQALDNLDAWADEMLAEAQRLQAGAASRYVDFGAVSSFLRLRDRSELSRRKRLLAVRALMTARFVEWFTGANRG